MAKQKIGFNTGAISLAYRVADRLIAEASGDAALLYLYLLRQDGYYDPQAAATALRCTVFQVAERFAELERLELVKGPEVDLPPTPVEKDAPEYTVEAIRDEMNRQSSYFPSLLREIEHQLGDKLNYRDLQQLMELYDYLALPAEVILLLTTHMVDEVAYRKGAGIKPRMWEIKREGYRWNAKGLQNLELATAYVEKMGYFRSNEGAVMAMVGIRNRTATDKEKNYIHTWLEMGFEDGVIQMAYEKTLFKTRDWNWNYCNGILKNWHKKGLHSLNAILDAERSALPRVPAGGRTAAPRNTVPAGGEADSRLEDIRWMQEFMKKHQGEFPGGEGGST